MKKALILLLALAQVLAIATARAAGDQLTDEEYLLFYEISDFLCEYWDEPLEELLWELEDHYDVSADEILDFLEYAVAADSLHVWVPVNGGQRFHAKFSCSKMIGPRPATKQAAYDMGFTPCGKCKPGR